MNTFRLFTLVSLACAAAATPAFAHAFLDHAVPAVGSSVARSPGRIELFFTENIVAAFSGASVSTAAGRSVASGRARVDPSNHAALILPLGRRLKPGVYLVHWHVVSVDTHRTSGRFKFNVAP